MERLSTLLPGYPATGPTFVLHADGQVFRPDAMAAADEHTWTAGPVTVTVYTESGADGSIATWLEAQGVRVVEEVSLLDQRFSAPPEEIHNHVWFNFLDMQKSTAVFLRDRDGGAFASWTNPFGRCAIEPDRLRMWYRPGVVVDGHFVSDRLVTGRWERVGREIRFEGRADRDGSGPPPAYLELIAADRPVVLDDGEISALRSAVASHTIRPNQLGRSAHWDWGENLYRRDPAQPDTQDTYRRLIDLCAGFGVEVLLVAPGNEHVVSGPSKEGPWQHIMWLGAGTAAGHGTWRPGQPLPDGVAEILSYAEQRGVGIAAYINPQFPWLLRADWMIAVSDADRALFGPAETCCLAIPQARAWLRQALGELVTTYRLAGLSLDFVSWRECQATDHPHVPGPDSVYAQWAGYRALVAELRADHPDLWLEGLIGAPNAMPWGAPGLTHSCPLVWDNQPQWVPAWPDVSVDRVYGNLQRRAAWWYRNLAGLPQDTIPGAFSHQNNRLRDAPVERGWDWLGARFNLLSAVASGPASLQSCFFPCWDADEWSAVAQCETEFFAQWIGFAREHAELLAGLVDLFGEPTPGAVDGTWARRADGTGFVFLANPNWTALDAEVPVEPGFALRELHPRPGRLWSGRVCVDAHEVAVLELIAHDGPVPEPEPDARQPEALLDWQRAGKPVALAAVGAGDEIETEWAPSPELADRVRTARAPIPVAEDQEAQPWSDPGRLRLYLNVSEPERTKLRCWVDDAEQPVQQVYVGTWPDVTDTVEFAVDRNLMGHYVDLTDQLMAAVTQPQWRVRLCFDAVPDGGFRGVHVATPQ